MSTLSLQKAEFRQGFNWWDITLDIEGGVPPVNHGVKLHEWPHAQVIREGETFVYEEANGIFTFGIVLDKDPMHNHQPYIWSSRAEVLAQFTGETMIDVAVHQPDGYVYAGYGVSARDLAPLLPDDLWIVGHHVVAKPGSFLQACAA